MTNERIRRDSAPAVCACLRLTEHQTWEGTFETPVDNYTTVNRTSETLGKKLLQSAQSIQPSDLQCTSCGFRAAEPVLRDKTSSFCDFDPVNVLKQIIRAKDKVLPEDGFFSRLVMQIHSYQLI